MKITDLLIVGSIQLILVGPREVQHGQLLVAQTRVRLAQVHQVLAVKVGVHYKHTTNQQISLWWSWGPLKMTTNRPP